MQDEDYFKLGVCHWDVTSVELSFAAQKTYFKAGSLLDLDPSLKNEPQTTYFKKKSYGDPKFKEKEHEAPDYSPDDPEVTQHPDEYFSIALTVKEAAP